MSQHCISLKHTRKSVKSPNHRIATEKEEKTPTATTLETLEAVEGRDSESEICGEKKGEKTTQDL